MKGFGRRPLEEARRVFGGRRPKKIVLQRQLADLGVQRLHVDGGLGEPTPAARTEHIGSTSFELRLPRCDLIGVKLLR